MIPQLNNTNAMNDKDVTQANGQTPVDRAEVSARQIFDEMKNGGFTLQEIVQVTRYLRTLARTEVDQTIKSMQEFSASI